MCQALGYMLVNHEKDMISSLGTHRTVGKIDVEKER